MELSPFDDPRYDAALDELRVVQAERARVFARECRLLATAATGMTSGWSSAKPRDAVVLEVAGTCLWGQKSAGDRLDLAQHLVSYLPGTLALLEAGDLFEPQARVLVSETMPLEKSVCAAVEARVLPLADLSPAAVQRRVRRAITALDSEAAARRLAQAKRDRSVWLRPDVDGMALIHACVPAADGQLLMKGLTEKARQAQAAGDPRTLDQLRADLLCALAAGTADAPGPVLPSQRASDDRRRARPVQVVVHVPVATALGLSEDPGDLIGYGPLPAPAVRELMATAELRKACVDPSTGQVLTADEPVIRLATNDPAALRAAITAMVTTSTVHVDTVEPQHDPSAALSRTVRFRDRQCDGIGCSRTAEQCELDHHLPWPEGPTSTSNLRARSQRCHHAKHNGWDVQREPDGSTTWTSPAGRRYTVPGHGQAPPGLAPNTTLPDPDALAADDDAQLDPGPDTPLLATDADAGPD